MFSKLTDGFCRGRGESTVDGPRHGGYAGQLLRSAGNVIQAKKYDVPLDRALGKIGRHGQGELGSTQSYTNACRLGHQCEVALELFISFEHGGAARHYLTDHTEGFHAGELRRLKPDDR